MKRAIHRNFTFRKQISAAIVCYYFRPVSIWMQKMFVIAVWISSTPCFYTSAHAKWRRLGDNNSFRIIFFFRFFFRHYCFARQSWKLKVGAKARDIAAFVGALESSRFVAFPEYVRTRFRISSLFKPPPSPFWTTQRIYSPSCNTKRALFRCK